MPGPCSAPNGDRSLLSSEPFWCNEHKEKLEDCKSSCNPISKRARLAQQNKLVTGKTAGKRK